MPLDLRARLLPAPRVPGYSTETLARQAAYYGDSAARLGADPSWVARSARQYEELGFDSVLVPQHSGWPDVWAVATWALAATTRLRVAVAHRIGLQSPTTAARALATLDQLSGGRVSLHLILGGSELDQQRDGDLLDKPGRYRRAHEYAGVVRRWLTSDEPFDHDGEHYHLRGAQAGWLPHPVPLLSYGGSSPDSLALAAAVADVYAVTAEPLAGTAELYGLVRSLAREHGRAVGLWFSTPNVILGRTDDHAWSRAQELTSELLRARDHQLRREVALAHGIDAPPESVNRERGLAAVRDADWHDRALWTGIARQTGYGWPAFVGSPQTVAEALGDYIDLGAVVLGIGSSSETREEEELVGELLDLLRRRASPAPPGGDTALPPGR